MSTDGKRGTKPPTRSFSESSDYSTARPYVSTEELFPAYIDSEDDSSEKSDETGEQVERIESSFRTQKPSFAPVSLTLIVTSADKQESTFFFPSRTIRLYRSCEDPTSVTVRLTEQDLALPRVLLDNLSREGLVGAMRVAIELISDLHRVDKEHLASGLTPVEFLRNVELFKIWAAYRVARIVKMTCVRAFRHRLMNVESTREREMRALLVRLEKEAKLAATS